MNVNDLSYWSYEQTFSHISLLGSSFSHTSFFTDEIMSDIVPQTGLFDSMAVAVLIPVLMILRMRFMANGCMVGRLAPYKKFYDRVIK